MGAPLRAFPDWPVFWLPDQPPARAFPPVPGRAIPETGSGELRARSPVTAADPRRICTGFPWRICMRPPSRDRHRIAAGRAAEQGGWGGDWGYALNAIPWYGTTAPLFLLPPMLSCRASGLFGGPETLASPIPAGRRGILAVE